MKELHNHIFSNTTCISKETMLKKINKQLSKSELHEIEKHMLDCAFCSEAFKGIEYAKNSSILFAIDNKIDQRAKGRNSKAPIMRNLMLAASVLIIFFGAYFTIYFFNKTVSNEVGLAINETAEFKQKERLEGVVSKKTEVNRQEDVVIKTDGILNDIAEEMEEENPKPILRISEEALAEKSTQVIVVFNDAMEDEINVLEDEDEEMFGEVSQIKEDKIREENVEKLLLSDTNPIEYASNVEAEYGRQSQALKKSDNKTKSKAGSTSAKKRKSKTTKQASPAYAESNKIEQSMDYNATEQETAITIASYTVVDYTDKYQVAYDLKSEASIQTEPVSTDFETKEDKGVPARKPQDEIVEITYKETLEKAMKLYRDKNYRQALSEFDNIIVKHPEEVNAQFYMGMCYYHLGKNASAIKRFNSVLKNKQTKFNEEANWNKALTLIKMKDTTTAKKLLNKIVKANGFYKVKAEEKLKGL